MHETSSTMSALEVAGSRMRRAADVALRVGAPLAVLAVVLAVFFGERLHIDYELQLIAPRAVPPGETLPIRALVFDRLEMPDGPRLTQAAVDVRLIDRRGRERARTRLERSPAGGADGMIAVPRDLRGRVSLDAVALVGGDAVASVHTAVDVQPDAPAPRLVGRLAGALQELALAPVETIAGEPPLPFDVRVVGGACVPEERCALIVHVGEPPAAVELRATPSVTPVDPDASGETRGLVLLPLVVHGPEARAELVATRADVEVAQRAVQLPVALATPAVELSSRVVRDGALPQITAHVLGDRPAVIIEAYRAERWARTGSFRPPAHALPFALAPGLWRLEAHTDPYASDRSAARMLVVRAPHETEAEALTRGIEALGGAPEGPLALRFAWAAASVEDRVHTLPESVSGHVDDVARLTARRERLRIAAVAALLLGLVIATVLFLRRGVEAALEAQRVMDETGDPALTSRAHRRRTLLSALALVATVLLAFLGAAALIVARAHLLE